MTEKVKIYQFSQIQQSQSKMNIQKLFDKYGYQNRLRTEGKKIPRVWFLRRNL